MVELSEFGEWWAVAAAELTGDSGADDDDGGARARVRGGIHQRAIILRERERDREKKSTSVFMWVWYELEIVAGVCLYRYFMPLLLCFYILNHRCYSCYQPNVIILVDFFFQILNKFFIFTHSHRIFFSHGKIENLILTTVDMWQDDIGCEKFTDDIRRRFQPSIISPTIFQRLWSSVKWSAKKFMTLFIPDGQNCR